MESHISVPVRTDQFLELAEFLLSKGDPSDPVLMVSTAIEYWLNNAEWKPELLSAVSSDARGYGWKKLFLPHGTDIRMQYKGKYHYARVEGDEILHEGRAISPGSLANTIAGGSRNAWRDLWIKRPSDNEWKLADDCRAQSEGLGEKLLQKLDALGKSAAERPQP